MIYIHWWNALIKVFVIDERARASASKHTMELLVRDLSVRTTVMTTELVGQRIILQKKHLELMSFHGTRSNKWDACVTPGTVVLLASTESVLQAVTRSLDSVMRLAESVLVVEYVSTIRALVHASLGFTEQDVK